MQSSLCSYKNYFGLVLLFHKIFGVVNFGKTGDPAVFFFYIYDVQKN